MQSVELFTGAGGLAIAVSNSGFKHQAVIEWDKNACDTLFENKQRGLIHVEQWPIYHMDVNLFDYTTINENIDLLAGGPPCQPFSLGGKHKGVQDERNMFPAFTKVVRELKPKAILVENVKGLLRSSFADYFEYIILQLSYPEIQRKESESWNDHLAHLEQYHTYGARDGLTYNVVYRLVNAADYGVPQKRERVFIVGFRNDLNISWAFPDPTHSEEVLRVDKWVTGHYWDRHKVSRKAQGANPLTKRETLIMQENLFHMNLEPWKTVRDAISDLPDVNDNDYRDNNLVLNHVYISGAKVYPGHTGSKLDEPAKTIKAGVHGVPGGENMLAYPDGGVRYFTIREAARLQTFPDEYYFPCSWTESMRQIGNAVPVMLGQKIAGSIREKLDAS